MSYRISQEYGAFLDNQLDWSVFATFTTEYNLPRNSARMLIERLNKQITKGLKYPLNTFWVAEQNGLSNNYHLHVLYYSPMDTKELISRVQNAWLLVSKIKGVTCQNRFDIREYLKGGHAGSYITKTFYEKDVEYDFIIYTPNDYN